MPHLTITDRQVHEAILGDLFGRWEVARDNDETEKARLLEQLPMTLFVVDHPPWPMTFAITEAERELLDGTLEQLTDLHADPNDEEGYLYKVAERMIITD